MLGCSTRVLQLLTDSGALNVDLEGHYSRREVSQAALDSPEVRKEAFIAQQNEALKISHAHNEKLTEIILDSARGTHDALIAENASLRERMGAVESKTLEIQETYFETMKTVFEMQFEAEKEKAALEMRKDALEVLKTQVLPVIRDSAMSTKLMRSFTDAQIQAFLEVDPPVLSEKQRTLLRAELQRRANAKGKENGRPENDGKETEAQDG